MENQKPAKDKKKQEKNTDKIPQKQEKEKNDQQPRPHNARSDTASERPDRGAE